MPSLQTALPPELANNVIRVSALLCFLSGVNHGSHACMFYGPLLSILFVEMGFSYIVLLIILVALSLMPPAS